MPMQTITVPAADGYAVPLEEFAARHPRARLLVLPALGVEARLYRRLGALLAEAGIGTTTLEQRGHGSSSLRPGRNCDFGFREWLQADIPAALHSLRTRQPAAPVYLAGHSLGGHLALMARALYPETVTGVVLLTTATPYYGCFQGAGRLKVRLLIATIPALTAVLGHYPGQRIGFGGREARRLMADWLVMARENRYSAGGLERLELEQRVRSDACPVLSVYCDRDELAPRAAIEGVTSRLKRHRIDWFEVTSQALGTRADHVSWAKHPAVAASAIDRWITEQASRSTSANRR